MPYMRSKSRTFDATGHICRVIFTPLLMLGFLCLVSPQSHPAQAAEHLSTSVIPTVGIQEVTEGTLLFRTTQPGRFIPAPTLKTDVTIDVTGIIARTISSSGVHQSEP